MDFYKSILFFYIINDNKKRGWSMPRKSLIANGISKKQQANAKI